MNLSTPGLPVHHQLPESTQTHACNTVLIPSLPLSPPAWLGVAWPSELISSVAQSCPTLCNSMDCSTPGLPVHHQLPEFTQTHVCRVSDAIQPSHSLSSPSPPSFSLSQHQGLFRWVSSSHQVAKVLEFQLQRQSFQWILRTVTTFKLTGNFSLQPKWNSSPSSGEHIVWKKESTTRCL